MASIEKRPGGRWRAKCRVGAGGSDGLRYGPSRRLKADAVRDGVKIDDEMARGIFENPRRADRRRLVDLVAEYCASTGHKHKREEYAVQRRRQLDWWAGTLRTPDVRASASRRSAEA